VVEGVQRRQRPAGIAVLAVVVVLDDPGVGADGPVQEREAPPEAQGHAEGILVRGEISTSRARGLRRTPRGNVDPLAVHRHRHEIQARRLERGAAGGIARLLRPGRLAGEARTRAQRSIPCWEPATTRICSAVQATPREAPR